MCRRTYYLSIKSFCQNADEIVLVVTQYMILCKTESKSGPLMLKHHAAQ